MLHPHLETKRVRFRPVTRDNAEEMYTLLSRLGVMALSAPDDFLESYDQGSEAVFSVRSLRSGNVLGFTTLQHLSPAGHVQAGVFTDAEQGWLGMGAEVSALLVNYAFAAWGSLNKIYFLTTDASTGPLGTGLAGATLEGTLREHQYFQGRPWDLYYYSVTRQSWVDGGVHFLDRLLRRSDGS